MRTTTIVLKLEVRADASASRQREAVLRRLRALRGQSLATTEDHADVRLMEVEVLDEAHSLAGELKEYLDSETHDYPKALRLLKRAARAVRTREDEESDSRTLASLAAMLGWENMPPRATLERDIAALKARAGSHPTNRTEANGSLRR